MKQIGLLVACIASVAAGFLAVLWLMPANTTPQTRGPKPLFAAQLTVAQTGAAQGMTVTPDDTGVLVASSFDPKGASANTFGAVYVNIDGSNVTFPPSGTLQLQVEITLPYDEISQSIEVQFVQNGLKQGGWQRAPIKLGRHTYTFDYDLIKDTRTGPKTETVWLRSDTAGRNRPVIWNALRVVKKI